MPLRICQWRILVMVWLSTYTNYTETFKQEMLMYLHHLNDKRFCAFHLCECRHLFKHYSSYVFDITGNTKSQRRRKQQLSYHSLKMHYLWSVQTYLKLCIIYPDGWVWSQPWPQLLFSYILIGWAFVCLTGW
jgi:hypothetical protein